MTTDTFNKSATINASELDTNQVDELETSATSSASVTRDAKGRLLKGVVLNPNGRPKKGQSLSEVVKKTALQKVDELAAHAVETALKYEKNPSWMVFLRDTMGEMPVKRIADVTDDAPWKEYYSEPGGQQMVQRLKSSDDNDLPYVDAEVYEVED